MSSTLPPYDDPIEFVGIGGPCEFLVRTVVKKIKTQPTYKEVFGHRVFDYMILDMSHNDFPSLQIFEGTEKWDANRISGNLNLWMVGPMGLRQERAMAWVRAAGKSILEAVFSSEWLFEDESEYFVPGLIKFGQTSVVDYERTFSAGDQDMPAMGVRIDYEVDQRMWEAWLCNNESRERDPWALPIVDLERITGTVDAYSDPEDVSDDNDPDVSLGVDTTQES